MDVLLLANNWPGLQVAEYLRSQGENIVGLGIHSPDKQRLTGEIVSASGVARDRVFEGPALRDAVTVQRIRVGCPLPQRRGTRSRGRQTRSAPVPITASAKAPPGLERLHSYETRGSPSGSTAAAESV